MSGAPGSEGATVADRAGTAGDLLHEHLALVALRSTRAIVAGWESGRLTFPVTTGRPFEAEVRAILAALGVDAAGPSPISPRPSPLPSEELARIEALVAAQGERCLARRAADPGHPLSLIAAELELGPLEVEVLLVVAAPRLWGELSRLYGVVANDPQRPLCDELLVCQVLGLGPGGREQVARALEGGAPLCKSGLLGVGSGVRPFAALDVEPLVVRRLRGERFDRVEPWDRVVLRAADRALDELRLPPGLATALVEALGQEREGELRLVLRGRRGSGRRTLCAALAGLGGRPLGVLDVSLFADVDKLPGEVARELMRAALRGWLPCVTGFDELPADEGGHLVRRLREVLRLHPGPLLLRLGPDAEPPLDPGFSCFELPPLDEGERAACWAQALAARGLPAGPAAWLGARYLFGPGVIERVAGQVAARSAPGAAVPAEDELAASLEESIRQYRDGRLRQIATRVTRLASWDSLVLPPEVLDSLYELIGRIDHRRTVYEEWGFDKIHTSSRGVTALFAGTPGTGKSMVAGVIARELGYDLYRVDLSRVLSKWIGETERNLAALFDAAEEGQAVILFDEADTLFSRRTEVKSSVDRYANAEVNYLLQRLDSFEGVAILTTNLGGSIDAAFKRRLSFRLTFPFPDEDAREQLWRVHLPAELPVEGAIDFPGLARRYKMSGGYIRNAVLRGAFLAAQEGSPLTMEHLDRAVRLEYREMGKLIEQGVLE